MNYIVAACGKKDFSYVPDLFITQEHKLVSDKHLCCERVTLQLFKKTI